MRADSSRSKGSKSSIPGCEPKGASVTECADLWNCVFKLDHCSKSYHWDGPIRKEHVKKHLNLPTEHQTRAKIAEEWSSKFSNSRYTQDDNYYVNALSDNKYQRLLLETYEEAKATGEVSFQHWNVTDDFKKYSVYEFSFNSDCPGDFYSGSFLRRRFDSLPYEHYDQDIVDYWQKKVGATSKVRYVERDNCAMFKWSSIYPYGVGIDLSTGTSRGYWA